MAKAIEAYIASNPVSARNLLKLLATDGFADLPNARTLQRFVADLEARKAVLFTALRDPDGYKSAIARRSAGWMPPSLTPMRCGRSTPPRRT
jgi:hypothetical protein